MLRAILTDKWFLGACVMLIVFAFGCYFWYQHELVPYRKSADESAERHRQWEADQKEADTSTESPKMVESVNDKVVDSNAISENIEGNRSQTADVFVNKDGEVAVSPFGFGPYPSVPPGWEGTYEQTWGRCLKPEAELLIRVRIKLLSQGVDVRGGTTLDGKIYPIIKGVRYVDWETDNGVRYISGSMGLPEDGDRLRAIKRAKVERGEEDILTEADIPSDIKLVDFDDGGLDPYEFLGLTPP